MPHLKIVNQGLERIERLGVRAGEAYLNTQPLYHVGGSCSALPIPLSLRCRVVMPLYYEVERVLRLIERERCVTRSGTATMFLDGAKHPRFKEFDLGSLRSAWTGRRPA